LDKRIYFEKQRVELGTFWAIFSQPHLVTLLRWEEKRKLAAHRSK
jgi:hypothetical protein